MTQCDTADRDFLRKKTILISGGAGYLASAIIGLLQEADCTLIRLDRQEAFREPISGCAKVLDRVGDVSDPALWDDVLKGVDIVFHLAAQTSTYAANDDPVADRAFNVMPMLYLLESCRRQGVAPIVCFSSTVTIAGIPLRLPVDETHPDHPLTVYDLHKLMAEQYLRWYSEQGFVQGVILRLANVYGPGPASSRSDRGILNQMICRALAGEPLTIYGAGDLLRDYVYVEDVARAFLAAARHAAVLDSGRFVIGSGDGHTIAEAVGLIAAQAEARTGRRMIVEHIEPPLNLSPIEQRNFIGDSSRFIRATGWRAQHTLAEGINLTMEAFS